MRRGPTILLEAIEAFLTKVGGLKSPGIKVEFFLVKIHLKRGLFSGKCFLVVFVFLHLIFIGQLYIGISIGKI